MPAFFSGDPYSPLVESFQSDNAVNLARSGLPLVQRQELWDIDNKECKRFYTKITGLVTAIGALGATLPGLCTGDLKTTFAGAALGGLVMLAGSASVLGSAHLINQKLNPRPS